MNSLVFPGWPIFALLSAALIALVVSWRSPLAAAVILALHRRACRLRSRTLETPDGRWHYLEGGDGPPLLLLHGFGGDADHFGRVARILSRRCRVIIPDLPGWGDSDPPGGELSMEAQAVRTFRFLGALGIDRVCVGGNSMGGYIAVAMARTRPERVHALWLLAPGGLRNVPHAPLLAEVEAGHHNPLVIRNRSDFRRLMAYCYPTPPRLPGPIERKYIRRAAGSIQRQMDAFNAMRHESTALEDLADRLGTPTLIVWGNLDRVLNPDGADVLHDLMPDSECIRLGDTGHLPMLQHPDREARRWLAFAERIDASGDRLSI